MGQQSFQGTVSRTSTKPWQDRVKGEIRLHSFQMEETGDRWFRTGTNSLVAERETVRFLADTQKGNVDPDSLEIVEAATAKAPTITGIRTSNTAGGSRAKSAPAAGGGLTRDEYWANKEKRDIEKDERYQTVDIPRMTFCTSQDAAIELVKLAISNEALTIPASKTKGSRLGILLGMVDEVTARLYKQRMAASVVTDEEVDDEDDPRTDTGEGVDIE